MDIRIVTRRVMTQMAEQFVDGQYVYTTDARDETRYVGVDEQGRPVTAEYERAEDVPAEPEFGYEPPSIEARFERLVSAIAEARDLSDLKAALSEDPVLAETVTVAQARKG